MSVVFLNMKFIMTDIQFAPLNSIILFILNIVLANILAAEYSDEYPAGWYLVKTTVTLHLFVSRHSVSYHTFLVACSLGLAMFDLTFLQAAQL